MITRLFFCLSLFVLAPLQAKAAPANTFDTSKVDFWVEVQDIKTDYRVLAIFVLPNEKVTLKAKTKITVQATHSFLNQNNNEWRWIAPEKPGLYKLLIRRGDQLMTLNMFVIHPASEVKNGKLNDYQMGFYQKSPFRKLNVYMAPRGFVEVTKENRHTLVSPHFTLGQFVCKQSGKWPKYLVLRPQLLIKMEKILYKLNKSGIRTDSFVVMSGYRTPWYNKAIGNTTSSSRHLYGDAADIFIDVNPKDGVMDDINKDGHINKADADFLYDLLEQWSNEPWWSPHIGGLAAYRPNSAHGPFLHIDARGYRARWGR